MIDEDKVMELKSGRGLLCKKKKLNGDKWEYIETKRGTVVRCGKMDGLKLQTNCTCYLMEFTGTHRRGK